MKTALNKEADLIGKTITGVFGLDDDLVLVMEDSFCIISSDCDEVEVISGKEWVGRKINQLQFTSIFADRGIITVEELAEIKKEKEKLAAERAKLDEQLRLERNRAEFLRLKAIFEPDSQK